MKWINKLLPKSSFARGVSILVSGTVGAQGLMVLSTPLLTRLYTPENFGLLAVFTALLAFFTVIASGRYELAIPIPEDKQDAADITILSTSIVLATTFFSLIVFISFPNKIALTLNTPILASYLILIPIGVFFTGMYQVFSAWSIRQKKFGIIAKSRLYQSIATLIVQLGGSFFGPIALILGHATGQGIGASGLSKSALKEPEFRNISFKNIKLQALRFKDFPLYSSGTALLNTASLQFAPLIFIALYGATVSGLYALTLRILSLPISVIGSAIGNVFLSEAPQANRNGTLPNLITALHHKLSLIGALPLVILLFYGPQIFVIAFGSEWEKAGVYAQWMAPWIYLQLQWSPLSMLSTVLEIQKAGLISQTLIFSSRLSALVLAWYFDLSSDLSIFIFAVISAIVYLAVMLWFFNKAGVSIKKVIFTDLKYISLATILLLPVDYIVSQ